MEAAVAALVGAGIGAVLGVVGTMGSAWITQRHQTRRDLMKAAVELGREEREHRRAQLESTGGGVILPVDVYVAHHIRLLQAIADGRYGPDVVRKLDDELADVIKAMPRRGKAAEVGE